MTDPQYDKLQTKIAKMLAILNSNQGDDIEVSNVDRSQAKNILDSIWEEVEGMANEAYRRGRTEGLRGDFRAGDRG
jgi:hypothetical protein